MREPAILAKPLEISCRTLHDRKPAAGGHPRFAKFRNLSLSSTPMEVMVLKRYNWIIWAPEDMGAL
ncbi:MAG: hypothetical protein ACE5FC_04935 [Myxococcota bacterium]